MFPMERRGVFRSKARPNEPDWVAPTWAELVRDHSAQVYRLAYRLTGNRHDAEDLTQDVFVRVFKSIHNFQPGTLEGWLHRITTNLFLDSARRRQRIRMDALSSAPEHVWGQDRSPEDLGTVRSRIARGRAQLRDALAHRAPSKDHARYLGVS